MTQPQLLDNRTADYVVKVMNQAFARHDHIFGTLDFAEAWDKMCETTPGHKEN